MIYRGISPIFSAVLVAVLTTFVTMYLIGGLSGKSVTAMTGTVAGVGISAVLAVIFGMMTGISGYNVSDIEQLEYVGQMTEIRIGELLYAGILISTLGAVMDVAMSVSSTISEIHYRNPDPQPKRAFYFRNPSGKRYDGNHVQHSDPCLYRKFRQHAGVYVRLRLLRQTDHQHVFPSASKSFRASPPPWA